MQTSKTFSSSKVWQSHRPARLSKRCGITNVMQTPPSSARPLFRGVPTVTTGPNLGCARRTSSPLEQPHQQQQQPTIQTRAGGDEWSEQSKPETSEVNKNPPNLFWRCFAAFMYMVPWIDSAISGRSMYALFRDTVAYYFAPTPYLYGIYFGSMFAPLIIFFLIFLAIVKNKKLHHFVRFHAMQSVMLDILAMLFQILKMYFPPEVKWSPLWWGWEIFATTSCMVAVLYCVVFALMGWYADIPWVSESCYLHVQWSDQ
jgi:uncharacterized membrane protein